MEKAPRYVNKISSPGIAVVGSEIYFWNAFSDGEFSQTNSEQKQRKVGANAISIRFGNGRDEEF